MEESKFFPTPNQQTSKTQTQKNQAFKALLTHPPSDPLTFVSLKIIVGSDVCFFLLLEMMETKWIFVSLLPYASVEVVCKKQTLAKTGINYHRGGVPRGQHGGSLEVNCTSLHYTIHIKGRRDSRYVAMGMEPKTHLQWYFIRFQFQPYSWSQKTVFRGVIRCFEKIL